MKPGKIFAATGLAVISCYALAADPGSDAITAAPDYAPDSVVADQLIECVVEDAPGVTTTDFFLVTNGAVKRYARSMNMARDMCIPGQPDCALGWRRGKIAMAFAMPDGTRHEAVIDLDNRSISKTQTSAEGAAKSSAGTCSSGPVPAGVTID